MRCPIHDLALAADGSCLRCRREEETGAALGRPRRRSRGPAIALGVVASGALLTVAWMARPRPLPPPPSPARAAGVPAVVAPAPLTSLEPATVSSEVKAAAPPANSATPLSRAMHLVKITLYSRPSSPECARARVWLLDRGYTFRERTVDADGEARAAWVKASPGGTVPAFDVDGQTFAGFDAPRLEGAIEYAGAQRLQR
jgi:glutaredoxin